MDLSVFVEIWRMSLLRIHCAWVVLASWCFCFFVLWQEDRRSCHRQSYPPALSFLFCGWQFLLWCVATWSDLRIRSRCHSWQMLASPLVLRRPSDFDWKRWPPLKRTLVLLSMRCFGKLKLFFKIRQMVGLEIDLLRFPLLGHLSFENSSKQHCAGWSKPLAFQLGFLGGLFSWVFSFSASVILLSPGEKLPSQEQLKALNVRITGNSL